MDALPVRRGDDVTVTMSPFPQGRPAGKYPTVADRRRLSKRPLATEPVGGAEVAD
jgi:hypothetical protein